MNNTQQFLKNSKLLGKKAKTKDAIGYISNSTYISENLLCCVFTIKIKSSCWYFIEGEIIEVPILGKTVYQCEKMLDELNGSHYPDYSVLSAQVIGERELFPIMIQESFINDFVEFGEKRENKKVNRGIEKILKSSNLSYAINQDQEQPQRAISNYLIKESQETGLTQKEFYQMVIDSAQHELSLM